MDIDTVCAAAYPGTFQAGQSVPEGGKIREQIERAFGFLNHRAYGHQPRPGARKTVLFKSDVFSILLSVEVE